MEKHYRSMSTGSNSSLTARRSSLGGRAGASGTSSNLPSPDAYDFDHDAESFRERPKPKPDTGSWAALPRKDQLILLFMARVVDFLQIASLQAFIFYQLQSYDENLTNAEISSQAGLLQGAFTGAQVCTAMLWGKAADATWGGRKMVLLIGLAGTSISLFGYGFATSFGQAMAWRMFGGAINGTVGIIRTMIAEITVEKKHQSRAFLILPVSFNIANFLGPVLGGLLADPSAHIPGLFGVGSIFGWEWLRTYPYALPSILNALALFGTGWCVFFFLEETSPVNRGKYDFGLHLTSRFKAFILRRPEAGGYFKVNAGISPNVQLHGDDDDGEEKPVAVSQMQNRPRRVLPFTRLWTKNVIFTLVMGAFYDFHLGAFQNMWTLFLSTPRALPEQNEHRQLPFIFTGGLGMPAATVGFATSIMGILGMLMQIFLYPPVQARLGTLRGFQVFLGMFPIAYFLAPYLVVLPSSSPAPQAMAGIAVWIGITIVLLFSIMGRTITLPAQIILLNNCSPHPSVLGTIHGLGQSVSAGFRTVGPIVGGWWYGASLNIGVVGASWWAVCGMSVLGVIVALLIYEGSGHEIYLEGEEEELFGTRLQTLREERERQD